MIHQRKLFEEKLLIKVGKIKVEFIIVKKQIKSYYFKENPYIIAIVIIDFIAIKNIVFLILLMTLLFTLSAIIIIYFLLDQFLIHNKLYLRKLLDFKFILLSGSFSNSKGKKFQFKNIF
jgi:hypothetical protein